MAQLTSLAEFGLEDRTYSIAEWLAIEERTGERFEYHEGLLVPFRAMAGGSYAHSAIGGNVVYALGAATRERQAARPAAPLCGAHTSDLKLVIPGTNRYVYPDAAVICGKPEYDARVPSAVRNPVVVAEVLSPSSAKYDTSEKFAYYASLPTLREYVIVEQEATWVEVRSRKEADGPWTFAFAKTLDASIELPSLGVLLPMAEIYRGVELPPDTADSAEAVPA